MRCKQCGAATDSERPALCIACLATSGAALPLAATSRTLWLWTGPAAQAAVATRDLAAILRTYRATTGATQRDLAESLGYLDGQHRRRRQVLVREVLRAPHQDVRLRLGRLRGAHRVRCPKHFELLWAGRLQHPVEAVTDLLVPSAECRAPGSQRAPRR